MLNHSYCSFSIFSGLILFKFSSIRVCIWSSISNVFLGCFQLDFGEGWIEIWIILIFSARKTLSSPGPVVYLHFPPRFCFMKSVCLAVTVFLLPEHIVLNEQKGCGREDVIVLISDGHRSTRWIMGWYLAKCRKCLCLLGLGFTFTISVDALRRGLWKTFKYKTIWTVTFATSNYPIPFYSLWSLFQLTW